MKKPTLKDVANKAGVSLGMASRVLGNYGSYSSDTKEKVENAARDLSYKKHGIARSLKLKSSRTIGMVMSNISNVFWATITRAIEDCASKSGYHLIVGNTDEDFKKERDYLETFCEGYVDGLLVSPSPNNHSMIKKIYRSGMPIVTIDRKIGGFCVPSVTIDNIDGAYQAVSHFISKGHRDIAIIKGIDGIMTSDQRFQGYCKALEMHGIEIKTDYVAAGLFQKEKAYQAALELLQLSAPPSAIFVCNETMAMGVYKALQDNQVEIGKHIDLIGFGDTDWATIVRPSLSCVRQPIYSMGVMACESLLRLVQNNDTQEAVIENICMKAELIIRNSC